MSYFVPCRSAVVVWAVLGPECNQGMGVDYDPCAVQVLGMTFNQAIHQILG
jgi:hypothetical protein